MRWGGIMTTAAQAGPAVSARFGGIPVLVTAEMAAQIKAFKQRQP